ncbi:MAG: hypothetical protein HC769_22935 [Cyanobacteria bacterium CRU_2_1]|nr:hypothetical protein [Cyanobacteria bacterium CRU_2_1]
MSTRSDIHIGLPHPIGYTHRSTPPDRIYTSVCPYVSSKNQTESGTLVDDDRPVA